MLGKRERFERTDVPRRNPLRPYISIAVIVVTAIACFILVSNSWHKANQMNGLNDHDLDDALYTQFDTTDPTDGYERSEDSFSNTLLYIVDDPWAEQPTLLEARIMVRNLTKGYVAQALLPLNTKLVVGERVSYLPTLYAELGPTGVLAALTDAANVHVSHVIICTQDFWEQMHKIEGPTLKALLGSSTDYFATMRSDFRTGEIVDIADWLREIGPENEREVAASYYADYLEDGTEVAIMDRQYLPRELGIYVLPGADEPPAEEAPVEGEAAPAEESSEG